MSENNWHARLSPSSMDRILKCPASAVLSDEDTGSAAAEQGTLAHSFGERTLCGETIDGSEWPDDEMKAGVLEYVSYIQAHMASFEGSKLYVESQIRSKDIGEYGGTIDALIVSETHIHVIDLKYGTHPVDARNNRQLMSYLTLADELYPGRKQFFASVVQPRVYGEPCCVEYSYSELMAHKHDVMFLDPEAPRVAGSHCRYCPLKKTCSTLADQILKAATVGFDDFDQPEVPSPARCLEIIELGPVMQKMVEESKQKLKQYLLEGTEVPGWRLAQSLGNRTWKDPEEVVKALRAKDIHDDVIFEKKLKSPTQLEKFSKAYKDIVAAHTHRPDRGAIAVEESSRLPDYVRPEDQFDDL